MKKSNQVQPTNDFQRLFTSLNIFQVMQAKRLIVERCCITEGTFQNWWYGRSVPRNSCNQTINDTITEVQRA